MLILLLGISAQAQPLRQLHTSFERDVSRYRWEAHLQLNQTFGAWQALVQNAFRSEALILGQADLLSFRDENETRWSLIRTFSPKIQAVGRGTLGWFSQGDVFSQEAYVGVRFHPKDFFWLEPALGYAWDRRPGVADMGAPPLLLDRGPAYAVRLAANPAPIDGYILTFSSEGAWQAINPRRGVMWRSRAEAARQFNRTTLALSTGYTRLRRDTYQATSFLNRDTAEDRTPQSIEATTADTLFASLQVQTQLNQPLRLSGQVDFTANNRFIRTLQTPEDALFFDTDFNRRHLFTQTDLRWQKNSAEARLALEAGVEVQRRRLANRATLPPAQAVTKGNLLQQADFDRSHLALSTQMQTALSGRTALQFQGAARIIRHDTPETNQDDRDEAFYNGQLGVLVELSRFLSFNVNLLGSYFHTVYLRTERSGENNVERALRLRPSIRWIPGPDTRLEFTTEVRATYTVDDFEIDGRRRRDQSARELRYEMQFEHRLLPTLSVLAEGQWSDLHLGRLLWDQFAEIPVDTLRTYSGWLRVQRAGTLTYEAGVRWLIRRDFDRNTTVRYPRVDEQGQPVVDENGNPVTDLITRVGREWIEQIGPTATVQLALANQSAIRVDGWLQVQRIRQQLFGDLPPDDAVRIRQAAQRGRTRLIPNLSMTVTWQF